MIRKTLPCSKYECDEAFINRPKLCEVFRDDGSICDGRCVRLVIN